jgi:hypothetical protein
LGGKKNPRSEKKEVWEREVRRGGMEAEADDGDSTKAMYHSQLPRGYYGL